MLTAAPVEPVAQAAHASAHSSAHSTPQQEARDLGKTSDENNTRDKSAGLGYTNGADSAAQHRRSNSAGVVEQPAGNGTELSDKVDAKAQQESSRVGSTHSTSTTAAFSTSAYRDFLHSSTASTANVSGASSAASSRPTSKLNSAYSSAYSSHAISENSSRTTSPARKADDVSTTLNLQALPLPQQTVPVATYGGSINFSSLKKSDSTDSLDELVTLASRPRPRPQHFTFTEKDIMKSFLRAAERDRARAEREAEKQREALRLQEEQNRRRQVFTAQQQQQVHPSQDVSTDEDDSSYDEQSAPLPLVKAMSLPVPVHFRFSTSDITRSASKASAKQNIGHWSTFPRSSTVMLEARELRDWIQARVAKQLAKEREVAAIVAKEQLERKRSAEKLLQAQQLAFQQQQQQQAQTAPTTPLADDKRSDSALSRVQQTQARAGLLRRASLPPSTSLVSPSLVAASVPMRVAGNSEPITPVQQPQQQQMIAAGLVARASSARPLHARSNSFTSVPVEQVDSAVQQQRAGMYASVAAPSGNSVGLERNTLIRRGSVSNTLGGTGAAPSAQQQSASTSSLAAFNRGLFESSLLNNSNSSGNIGSSSSRRATAPLPVNQVAANNAAAMQSAAARRAAVQQSAASAGAGNVYSNYANYAQPSSSAAAAMLTAGNGASRVLSGAQALAAHLAGDPSLWPSKAERESLQQRSANLMYRDVPSSGYGQQPRSRPSAQAQQA